MRDAKNASQDKEHPRISILKFHKLFCYRSINTFEWSLATHICVVYYSDVIMGTIASQITRLTIVYSTVYSDADQRKHQSSPSLAFVRVIHRSPVNSPRKGPVTRKMFPLDDVIMEYAMKQTSAKLLSVGSIPMHLKKYRWKISF